MERSVIFTPVAEAKGNFRPEDKIRAVNPHFRILRGVVLTIGNERFSNAYRVFDPYDDEERFLRAMDNISRVCNYGNYFYIDGNGCCFEINPQTNTKTPVENLLITEDNAEEVGHMMPIMLGSVVNACPELKPIIDIGRKKQ